ncbi:MAG: hypothetical protein KF797_01070 [Flavobacteriales bacterium]|nr:hypothetical protein [Flavobacteriales bacterium]
MFRLPHPAALALCLILCMPVAGRASADQDVPPSAMGDPVTASHRVAELISEADRSIDKDLLQAHAHAVEAMTLAGASGDGLMQHKALACLGTIEERMGLYGDMLATTRRRVQVAQGLGDPLMIAMDLRELASAYRLNEMSEKAVEEARNSLAMMLPTRPLNEVEEARLFLIHTLHNAGRYDEAFRIAEHAMAKAVERGDLYMEARFARSMGDLMLAQRRFADAIGHFTQARRSLPEKDAAEEHYAVCSALARAYIGLGRIPEALAATREAGSFMPEVDNWNNRSDLLDLRYQLATAQHHWPEAIMLLNEIKRTSDSVLISRLDMQTARLQMRHRPDHQERANVEAAAGDTTPDTSNGWLEPILIGLLALLGIVASTLFLSVRRGRRLAHRLKVKSEQIQEQQQRIHAKDLELQRQSLRLAETLLSEEEKEMMIKEIHHRVKNNLQVVDSLLQIQALDANAPDVQRVLRVAQGRIRSMALVHEQIYHTSNGRSGDLRTHLEKLIRNILAAHGAHDRISVRVDTTLPIFRMETLLPLTLVVNELFTNALKYAFNEKATGRIIIVVRPTADGYELLFNDDGCGLAASDTRDGGCSFGMELLRILAEQLNGELRFMDDPGTAASLVFAPDPVPMRVAC